MSKKKSKEDHSNEKLSGKKKPLSGKNARVIEMTPEDLSEADANRQGRSTQQLAVEESEAFQLDPEIFQTRDKLQAELQSLSCVLNPITGELECIGSRMHDASSEFAPAAGIDPWGNPYSSARSFMRVASPGIDPFGNVYCSYLRGEDEIAERFDPINDGERILGTGYGYRTRNGAPTGEVALKVYIDRKAMRVSPLTAKQVPTEIDGMPVDVEAFGGEIIPLARFEQSATNPGLSRYSVCNYDTGNRIGQRPAGTLGGLVELNDGRLCLLSSHHVLSPAGRAQEGDRIIQVGASSRGGGIQPLGLYTSNHDRDSAISTEGDGVYQVDADVAFTSYDQVQLESQIFDFDPEPTIPKLGMKVVKIGSTTREGMGIISAVGVNTSIQYPGTGLVSFTGQIVIQGINCAFSAPGNAGMLICQASTRRPVGLLFAGSSTGAYALANPIQAVMKEVGIKRFIS